MTLNNTVDQSVYFPFSQEPYRCFWHNSWKKYQSGKIIFQSPKGFNPKKILGLDCGENQKLGIVRGGGVLWNRKSGKILEKVRAVHWLNNPTRARLLGFQEGPILAEVLQKFSQKPDLILVGDHGIAGPSRFGLACQVGLFSGLPTLGVGSYLQFGSYDPQELNRKGFASLNSDGEPIGWVVNTKIGSHPVFISPGGSLSVKESLSQFQKLFGNFGNFGKPGKYKLPIPLDLAREIACVQPWDGEDTF